MSDEDKAWKRSADRYWSRWKSAAFTQHETDTSVGRQLLRHTIQLFRGKLDPWLDRASTSAGRRHSALDVFSLVENRDLLSLLILRAVVDGISTPRTSTSLAIRVGDAIEQEYRLREVDEKHGALVNQIQQAQFGNRSTGRQAKWILRGVETIKGTATPRLPTTTRLRAGVVAIELVEDCGIVEQYYVKQRGQRRIRMVRASESLVAWLSEAHGIHELLRPLLPPLTHPPIPWTSEHSGGYVTLPLPLVKHRRGPAPTLKDAPLVYEALNIQQATEWEINTEIADIMREAWERNLPLGGLPTSELTPMPTKPLDIDTNEKSRTAYAREASWVRSHRNQERARRLHVAQLLASTQEYGGLPLYFPMNIDFRGRMYAAPGTLNHQGSGFAKSLLRFSKAMPIGDDPRSERDFYAHGANLFGIAGTYKERFAWVIHNEKEIAACAEDPFNVRLWQLAKDPWPFLAWALEAAQYWRDPECAFNRIPISIDASCNGCQLWSLLLQDKQTAQATNTYPNETPADVYQSVADDVISRLPSDDDYGSEWARSGLIDRGLIKGAVLIIPYAATHSGMADALLEALYESYRTKPRNTYQHPQWVSDRRACMWLAKIIRESTAEIIPAVLRGMEWMQEVAGICADNDLPAQWVSPTGLLVVNDYRTTDSKTIETFLGERYVVSTLTSEGRKLSRRRCRATITANYTHSMDAALAAATVVGGAKRGIEYFHIVHDCFGTHAANLGKLRDTLLSCGSELFVNPQPLEDMRERLSGVDGIPLPPIVGDFDPQAVTLSAYFAS